MYARTKYACKVEIVRRIHSATHREQPVSDPDSGGILIALPIGLLLIGWGLWLIFRAIMERDLRVIVMNDGFVLTKAGKHQVFRWADIAKKFPQHRPAGGKIFGVRQDVMDAHNMLQSKLKATGTR